MAVNDESIAHDYRVIIISAIDCNLRLAERCEFSFPGPTTVLSGGFGWRSKPRQQKPLTLNDAPPRKLT